MTVSPNQIIIIIIIISIWRQAQRPRQQGRLHVLDKCDGARVETDSSSLAKSRVIIWVNWQLIYHPEYVSRMNVHPGSSTYFRRFRFITISCKFPNKIMEWSSGLIKPPRGNRSNEEELIVHRLNTRICLLNTQTRMSIEYINEIVGF